MSTKLLQAELVYDRWLKLYRCALLMPDGRTEERHVEDHGRAVAVLPYDEVARVAMLITQPRAPVLRAGADPVLEVVAGLAECDDPADDVRREALEEAGLLLTEVRFVTAIWSMIGISTEYMDLYLACYRPGDRIASGGGASHENEAITLHEVPLATLGAMVRAGELRDAKTLILVQRLMLDRPDLFA